MALHESAEDYLEALYLLQKVIRGTFNQSCRFSRIQ